MRELLIGCGSQRKKHVYLSEEREFHELTTLDIEERHNPDVVWDLNVTPWPFDDNSFDEVHAYEVLEHLGKQGDYRSFFAHFTEIWRVLKPGGQLYGSVPMWDSPWAWSDPGHTRIISKYSFIFLDQREYEQVGKTAITDYRDIYKGDLQTVAIKEDEHQLAFVLKAIK
jgi:predicted SAM-dependent methyltransferase